MTLSDETAHQRTLLVAQLKRLMAGEEHLARNPDMVTLVMDYDQTLAGVNQVAARLGLGTFPQDLAAILAAAGLRDAYYDSLQRQRRNLRTYRQHLELQAINADPVTKINLQLQIQTLDHRLAGCDQRLAVLAAQPADPAAPANVSEQPAAGVTPAPTGTARPGGTPRAAMPADWIGHLRQVLRACDEYFDSNRDLRALFADPRLRPWRAGLPEAESLKARVDRLIAYLQPKHSTAGENALYQFIQVLAEQYDPSDDRHTRLLALVGGTTPPAAPAAPSATPETTTSHMGERFALMPTVDEAERMLDCARAIALVTIDKTVDGQRSDIPTGSAWLIAPGLAITCWHVLEARTGSYDTDADPEDLEFQVANGLLTFRFTRAGYGLEYGIARLEYAHQDTAGLDYALLRLRDRADHPLAERAHLHLDLDIPMTSLSRLAILQHPGGQPQQQSAGTYVARHPTRPERIHYSNRTEGGTSGAPVFNRVNWRVVALHHGTHANAGEGILLRAILADLHQQRPDLYQEIQAAQAN
jgi:hypothetical protein